MKNEIVFRCNGCNKEINRKEFNDFYGSCVLCTLTFPDYIPDKQRLRYLEKKEEKNRMLVNNIFKKGE